MSEETYEAPVDATDDLPEADLASLLAVNDAKEEWLPIPEWGFKIKIKSLSKADQIKCRKRATRQGKVDDDAFEGHLLLSGIVSPRLSPEHLDRLQAKNVGVVTRITRRILELSSMVADDVEEAEADFSSCSTQLRSWARQWTNFSPGRFVPCLPQNSATGRRTSSSRISSKPMLMRRRQNSPRIPTRSQEPHWVESTRLGGPTWRMLLG
jgi:hypothetical protein